MIQFEIGMFGSGKIVQRLLCLKQEPTPDMDVGGSSHRLVFPSPRLFGQTGSQCGFDSLFFKKQ